MDLAREANCRVEMVSSFPARPAETHAIIAVLQFPPRESCRMRVNFESRYGTCTARPRASTNVEMTCRRDGTYR